MEQFTEPLEKKSTTVFMCFLLSIIVVISGFYDT